MRSPFTGLDLADEALAVAMSALTHPAMQGPLIPNGHRPEKRRTYDFIEEPRGTMLRQLLQELRACSSTVSLVVRDALDLSDGCRAILARLEPRLIAHQRCASRPQIAPFDHDSTELRFRLDDILLVHLTRASDGLYGWRQPNLPEDFALLREDGTAILSSRSRDSDAWLELSDREYESLVRSVPGLFELVRPHEDDELDYFVG